MAVNDDTRGAEAPLRPILSRSESASTPVGPPTALRQVQVEEALLRTLVFRLEIASSVATTAAMALAHQNAEFDADIASVLRRHVVDALGPKIDVLKMTLGINIQSREAGTDELSREDGTARAQDCDAEEPR